MIQEKEYKKRRDIFANKLDSYSIAVLFSATNKTRSNDTEFPFRQGSDFYYLTGFIEDNSCLIILKFKKKVKSILFVQKKDKTIELWNGKRLGKKEAKKRFFIDEIYASENLNKKLIYFVKDKKSLYFNFNSIDKRNNELMEIAKGITTHKNLSDILGLMRLIKSNSEINLIKKAISITKKAHHEAIVFKKFDKNEYQLQAEIEYVFKKNGAYSDAYTSIVACGNSANTLHYIQNNQKLENNKLILIDAGCEYEYYASDITRTIPVNGSFSIAQKELYNMVLDVQLQVIEMIRPDIKRSDLQTRTVELLTKGMVNLGILKGSVKTLIKKEKYKKYYPHGIGHWMGIDVHDESPYRDTNNKEIRLKKGMVLTIEPGIYLDEEDTNIPEKYRGVGIRIEDDILVTKNGYKNLSKEIAKSVEEIERLYS